MVPTNRADLAATLRRAVRDHQKNGKPFRLADLVTILGAVRTALCLKPLEGGAARDAIQRVCKGTALQISHSPNRWHYVRENGGLWVPSRDYLTSWRYLMSHSLVDILHVSRNGFWDSNTLRFEPAESYLPELNGVRFGVDSSDTPNINGKKGLYVADYGDKNHIGQTNEATTRWRTHRMQGARSMLFFYPDVAKEPTLDALFVAEALAIYSFDDVLTLKSTRCTNKSPTNHLWLQEGSAFSMSFAAALLRWWDWNPCNSSEGQTSPNNPSTSSPVGYWRIR